METSSSDFRVVMILLIILSDFLILITNQFPIHIGKFAHAYFLWKLIDVISTDIIEVYWSIIEAFILLWIFVVVSNSLTALRTSRNLSYWRMPLK